MKLKSLLFSLMLLVPLSLSAAPPIGEILPIVTLSGEAGGRVDGSSWSSEDLKDKVCLLFYVDPDESDINKPMEKALKDADFPEGKTMSVVIVNMDATWLPNFAISSKLESSQEDHPDTIYVKDMDKALVKAWNMTDDNFDVVVIAPNGKVVYTYDGKMTEADIEQMIAIIKENLP